MLNKKLGEWYEKEKRDLPWRNSSDPYKIWLSEIILQQTRVEQGLGYYLTFLKKFPDIFSLANAETDEILKVWQGLGYYSRARNLHETAKFIVSEYRGFFPSEYRELIKLKGIGPYTAAAISSIAFNKARAAVDGNVKRVISRLFTVEHEINSTEGIRIIGELAEEMLDRRNPGNHNQAVMELGATICLPKNPSCSTCPLNLNCLAYRQGKVTSFPVNSGRQKVRDRYFNYLIIRQGESIWINQRSGNDIWKGLFEFPLIETKEAPDIENFHHLLDNIVKVLKEEVVVTRISDNIRHKLSHLNINTRFIHVSLNSEQTTSELPGIRIKISSFEEFAVPRLIDRYIGIHGF